MYTYCSHSYNIVYVGVCGVQVTELCEGRVVEGGEVEVWAVRVLKEGVAHSSQTQLLQKCGQWRATLISALQASSNLANSINFIENLVPIYQGASCAFFSSLFPSLSTSSLSHSSQTSSSLAALEEVSGCVSSLVSRAHSLGVRDFSTAHLPPLLSSLLQYREAAACLQVAVLPAVSTIFLCYPTACKNHRVSSLFILTISLLQWNLP